MKSVFIFALVLSAHAFASPVLVCKTQHKVDGWTGTFTHDHIRFTAYVLSNERISKAKVSGAYGSDVRDLAANKKYVPKASAYQTYNRFEALEDAWNWFAPLLPKKLLNQRGTFTGYLQVWGEEGYKGTQKLNCFLRGLP